MKTIKIINNMKNKKNIIEQKQLAKTLEVFVQLNVVSEQASSKEPIGPTLGQYGVPIIDFCNLFNQSSNIYEKNIPLRAHVLIYSDKTFELDIKIPTIYYFLKSSLLMEETDLFKLKRKAGYIDLRNNFLPIYNKNTLYTIIKYISDNLIFIMNLKSFFKKTIGTIYSSGFFFYFTKKI
jgi:ribosomal protein L11